jgi:uncharacterized protein (DUF4415 family)
MRKVVAEEVRDIDFAGARRGRVVPVETGKTKLSIRLDTKVIEHFREAADAAGGGNYQSMINDALVAYIHQKSMLAAVRQVVREELVAARSKPPRRRERADA